MCMVSYFGPGVLPVEKHLTNGANTNPDGHGFAIITEDNRLLIDRSMFSASLIDEFMTLRELHPQGPALFHSRISTSGGVNLDGCHPFKAGGDPETVIAHNGILFAPPKGSLRSDTRIFAEDIFPRKYKKLDNDRTRAALREYLTGKKAWYPNKMVILTVNPRYKYGAYLFGADKGYWVEGESTVHDQQVPGVTAWHSNDGWKKTWFYGKYSSSWEDSWQGPAVVTSWWDACQFCGSEQSVDPDTQICNGCNVCVDCGIDSYECMCYVPLKFRIGASQ